MLAAEREAPGRALPDSGAAHAAGGKPGRDQVTGVCLCGGASRRMGRDKALLELAGRRLIDYPLEALAAVAVRTVLACGNEPRYAELGLPQVCDTGPGEGPLRGLLAGLEAAETPWVVALACDMPRVSSAALEALLAHAARERLDACLAEVERGTQPLLAVYRADCAVAVRAALARGERRLVAFHRDLRVGSLRLEELDRGALNLNTPDELGAERAARLGRDAAAGQGEAS